MIKLYTNKSLFRSQNLKRVEKKQMSQTVAHVTSVRLADKTVM